MTVRAIFGGRPIVAGVAFGVAALVLSILGAPAPSLAQEGEESSLSTPSAGVTAAPVIGGGVPFGLYFPLAGAICTMIDAAEPAASDVNDDGEEGADLPVGAGQCTVAPMADSARAIEALQAATVDLALVQSDWLVHAVEGSSRFGAAGPAEGLRTVAALHGEGLVLLVRSDGEIRAPSDLAGARVSRGPADSYRSLLTYALLEAVDLDTSDLALIGEEEVRPGVEKLCRGETDAVAAVTAMPDSIAAAAPPGCDVDFLTIPEDIAERASDNMPGVEPLPLPREAAAGADVKERLTSFGLTAVLTTMVDANPTTIARAVRALIAGAPALAARHPALASIAPERLSGADRFGPLHPAAASVYGK
ncbi:TAXI family TRAP transporter solute-binding subunit [Marivibrio halodurans]|uniref:TAXI family TRAP transporter solute-binding subunit n=1 Tax=Marivibrio halodurans TaxID=2039722 RepID=A0A8J7V351_9PROT|nr:TAXI family TRAP transporter solute-binding subunit [Marivibrio halodurans]MBP5857577.1 TAXI family TRAP transporter solute-binding subunit [Marivibrio halodurans]